MQDVHWIFTPLLLSLKLQFVCINAVKVPSKRECKQSTSNQAKSMTGASYRLCQHILYSTFLHLICELALNNVLKVSSRNKSNYVKMPKLNLISSWNTKR